MASSDSEKYLTEELLINIFRRVDVKSIRRCTCVCKTWHHVIIHSAALVKDHLTYQKTSSHTRKYILHYNSKRCKLLRDYDPLFNTTKHSKLYYTPKLFDTCDHLKIHGMCDGLLCFSTCPDKYRSYYRIGDNLYLYNPTGRKAKKLPKLKISNSFIQNGGVSFGYYGDDYDYKVIVISSCMMGQEYIVSVYSLSSNCWNIIHTKCYYEERALSFSILHPTKFIDGTAYMIAATRQTAFSQLPLTVYFDLRDDTIQQLKSPEEFVAYGSNYTIETYGETIAVFGCSIGNTDDIRHLAIWTLLRDKVSSKSSWEKKFVIRLQEAGYSINIPVGFLYNGKYLIRRKNSIRPEQTTFLLCDLESLQVTEYRTENYTGSHSGTAIIPNCVESLLLLNEDSVDPFVHSEMESSCSSILFTLQKDILPTIKCMETEPKKLSKQNRRNKRARRTTVE